MRSACQMAIPVPKLPLHSCSSQEDAKQLTRMKLMCRASWISFRLAELSTGPVSRLTCTQGHRLQLLRVDLSGSLRQCYQVNAPKASSILTSGVQIEPAAWQHLSRAFHKSTRCTGAGCQKCACHSPLYNQSQALAGQAAQAVLCRFRILMLSQAAANKTRPAHGTAQLAGWCRKSRQRRGQPTMCTTGVMEE